MQIQISESIHQAAPELALGIVTADVQVREVNEDLRKELEHTAERLQQELVGVDLAQMPQIQALRRLYRGLGKDPTRYRGSAEALLRRIVSGKGLYFINSAVDVCNLISIETRHCLGAYDLEKLNGPLAFRPATAGEVYRGIGRGELNLEGLPVFCDDQGPFGSPTSDSERTMLTLATRRLGFVIIACTGATRLQEYLHRTAALLQRYAQADHVTLAFS